jgi:hypothetical protein
VIRDWQSDHSSNSVHRRVSLFIDYEQANSSITGPLQKSGRRDLVGGVLERKKKKLARSEGEQVLGTNRASNITV